MTTSATTAKRGHDGALHFPLQEDEQVLMICRKHWLFLWPMIAGMAVAALVPIVVIAVLLGRWGHLGDTEGKVFWVAAIVYGLYWAVRMFLNWYRYNNDIWVITDQRLVDSTKTNPFSLKTSTADLVNVQDMTVERSGIFRTMFNYGDIVCQTAADIQEFRMTSIPHPQEVQLLVDKERDRERMRGRS